MRDFLWGMLLGVVLVGTIPSPNPPTTKKENKMAPRRVTPQMIALEDETQAGQDFIVVEILGQEYQLRRKFKRLKFLRLLSSDPGSALGLVFLPESLERLEDQDMTDEQLQEVFEKVSLALVGTKN